MTFKCLNEVITKPPPPPLVLVEDEEEGEEFKCSITRADVGKIGGFYGNPHSKSSHYSTIRLFLSVGSFIYGFMNSNSYSLWPFTAV